MKGAKIQLSEAEMELFGNAGVILTKNRILHKTKLLLEDLQAQLQQVQLERYAQNPFFSNGPKISRGENYEGLPYLVLDYPRVFERERIFAIRSFFWWGHFFSSTLHIDGTCKAQFAHRIAAAAPLLAQHQYFLHTGTNAWAHHFGADNYTPAASLLPTYWAALHHRQAPIKIAARWPLHQWPAAANYLRESWQLLLDVCFD